jgi:anti-sigma factor RsiW
MTCRHARKLLPLLAGDDLSPKKARRLGRHLASCPACRAELEELRAALDAARAWARADDAPAWDESSWTALTRRIRSEQAPRRFRARLGPLPIPSPALTAGVTAAALIAVLAFVFKGTDFRSPDGSAIRPVMTAAQGTPRAAATAPAPQDRLSVTLVSQETGLQVVWIFDKNFEWKGEQN